MTNNISRDDKMINIIIIGDSGHSKVIEDIINTYENYNIIAKLDDKYKGLHQVENLFKGPTDSIYELLEKNCNCKVIIAIGANKIREKIVMKLKLNHDDYLTIVHPSAIVSDTSILGVGTVVMPNAIINASASVGHHAIINSGAIVEHDCVIDNFVHISPSATVAGSVHLNEGVHLGVSASVIPLKKVGEWTVIGAGAVVTENIPPNVTAVGVPARVIKER